MTNNTPLGVIEGFFGRSWSWQQRMELADFLRNNGFDYYLYAPKNDRHLRSQWRQDWSRQDWQALCDLRQGYSDAGIEFGIGLSPLDLCSPEGRTDGASLDAKIRRINQLQPDILALLFDDMRGDLPQLAATQAELCHRVAALTGAKKVILCPTYYSDDPILEKVFGDRPEGYWQTLGRLVDPAIDIFWTGPKVCTERYTRAHLSDVAERLQRRPTLWDNYPVNDGAVKSKHLYLKPFSDDRASLGDLLAGHAVNPMNQFNLSKLALASLPHAYTSASYQPDTLFNQLLERFCSPKLRQSLQEDAAVFAQLGLDGMSPEQRAQLSLRYRKLQEQNGMAAEVADWLDGEYAFDPSCLTD